MPLFGKSSKSPVELARLLKESLLVLEKGADGKKQVKQEKKYFFKKAKVCAIFIFRLN